MVNDVILFFYTNYGQTHINRNIIYVIASNFLIAIILQYLSIRLKNFGLLLSEIFAFIIIMLTITEIIIYKTFDTFMPPLALIGNTKNVIDNFFDDFKNIVVKNILLIALPIIFYIALIVFANKCLLNKMSLKKNLFYGKSYKIINFAILIASLLLLLISYIMIEKSNDFSLNVKKYGLKMALVSEVCKNVVSDKITYDIKIDNANNRNENSLQDEYNVLDINFQNLDVSGLDERFADINYFVSTRAPSKKNNYTGIFKGKNLIMICAEAFSSYVVNETLTPTLYRLINNGFKFTDFYVPSWGGSTISGEFAFLNGIIPEDQVDSMKRTANNNMCFTLPRALKREGYMTGAYHNGRYTFYDRQISHNKNIGFDYFLAVGNGIEKITGSWPNDIKLFSNTFDTYCDKTPFCIYYMTLSGHAFYNDNLSVKVTTYIDRVKELYGDTYPDQINNYLCAQLFLEDALKVLIEKLDEKNMLNDTVICVVSDHYPYGLYNNAYTNGFDYLPFLYEKFDMDIFDRDKNMPIIWCGALENEYKNLDKTIDSPASSLDLTPTLLNLFGLKYDSRLLVGRDVFSDATAFVPYNNEGYIVREGRKYSLFDEDFTAYNGQTINEDLIKNYNILAKNLNLFSKFIVDTDYYNYIFTNKNVPDNLKEDMKFDDK